MNEVDIKSDIVEDKIRMIEKHVGCLITYS